MSGPACVRGRGGTATIEFAIIAPVLLTLLLGTIELSNVFRVQAKLNIAAGQLAVMVAAASTVTAPSGSLKDVCTGAMFSLLPYSTASVSADIVSITNAHPADRTPGSTDTSTVQTYLDWENVSSCTTSATAMGLSGAKSLANSPTSLLTASGQTSKSNSDLAYNYSAAVVQMAYQYQNVVTSLLGRTIPLSATAVARPRSNKTITCTTVNGTSACPSQQ